MAKPEDINAISILWLQLMDLHHRIDPQYYSLKEDRQAIFCQWLTYQLKSPTQFFFVAEEDSTAGESNIKGFISGYIKSLYPWFITPSVGHISFLVIDKKHRRKGIGKLLEAAVIKYLMSKNIHYIEIYANEKNITANFAWNSWGYKPFNKFLRKEIHSG